MQQLNALIKRRRTEQVIEQMAQQTEQDLHDLAVAEEELNGLGATLSASGSQLAQLAKGVPGGDGIYRGQIAPKINEAMSRLNRLVVPLRSFGERARTRQAECQCEPGWDKSWGGPITPDERDRTLATAAFPFCRAFFQSGALSKTFARTGLDKKLRLFDRGRGEDRVSWGYADGTIDAHASDLLREGTLRPGAVFEGYGFGFAVVQVNGSPAVAKDLEILGRGLVRWTEQNDTHKIDHRLIKYCPMPGGVDQNDAGGAASGARFVGEPYLNNNPILRLRGQTPKAAADKGHALELEWEDATLELTADYYLYAYLLGEHLQAPGGK